MVKESSSHKPSKCSSSKEVYLKSKSSSFNSNLSVPNIDYDFSVLEAKEAFPDMDIETIQDLYIQAKKSK